MKPFAIATLAAFGVLLAFLPAARATVCIGLLTGTYASVVVPEGITCTLDHAAVTGDVIVIDRASLVVKGGAIGGDVYNAVSGCYSVTLTNGVAVGGNVSIDNCTHGGLSTATVGGSVDLSDNTGGVDIEYSTVAGSVTVNDNTSPAPVVEGNTIAKNLTCSGNSPAPTDNGHPNTVGGTKTGQCSTL